MAAREPIQASRTAVMALAVTIFLGSITIIVTAVSGTWKVSQIESKFSASMTRISTILDGVVVTQRGLQSDARSADGDRGAIWMRVGALESRESELTRRLTEHDGRLDRIEKP